MPKLIALKVDITVSLIILLNKFIGMVDKIMDEDDESVKLRSLQKFGEYFQQFESTIDDPTGKYQTEMKAHNKEKKRIYIYCEQILKEAEREAEQESIKLIQKFENLRKHKFREIQKQDDEADLDVYENDLMREIEILEDNLTGVEMKLQDTLSKSTQDFCERVKKLIDDMRQKTQNQ